MGRLASRRILGAMLGMAVIMLGWPQVAQAAPTDPISISDASLTEGNSGTTNMTFTISYTGPNNALMVDYATANGTATQPGDYTAKSGTASLPSGGCKCTTITVVVKGDTSYEGNETLVVNLSNPSSPGQINDPQGVGTITDDDTPPTLSVNNVATTEGNIGSTVAQFTVTLSASSILTTTVNYATGVGSATAGSDYVATSGTLTFAPGETTKTFSVSIIGDVIDEPGETYSVNLSNPTNASILDGQGVGTINDDDPIPSLSVANVSSAEGNSGTSSQTFIVSLNAPSGRTVTIDFVTNDGNAVAGSDYDAATGTLTFLPGDTTKNVSVTIHGDTTNEVDETYTLDLSNPVNAQLADGQASGTIVDDDQAPTISVGDTSVAEGNSGTSLATFAVTLSAASGKTITVGYATNGGTAVAGSDYTSTTGTLTFDPGQTSKNVPVPVSGDATYELDEGFTLELSGPTNASLADGTGAATITNDDAVPVISVNDRSVFEGDAGGTAATFTVSLDTASGLPVTVQYATTNNTATAGSDYTAASGTLTFDPGETQQSVGVLVNSDTISESDETFTLGLSNATGATIGDTQGVGTILNDDGTPTVSVADVTKAEGNSASSPMAFVVTMSFPTQGVTTVGYATSDGTATAGSDYDAATGTVTFQPGTTTSTVNVAVNGDNAYEGDETLTFTLSNPSGVAIANGTATGTITNDDKIATSLTLSVTKGAKVTAKGVLNGATDGDIVTVVLAKKKGRKYVGIATKPVAVANLLDRNSDGLLDATYAAAFRRPGAGVYRFTASFAGSDTHRACSVTKGFKL